MWWGMLSLVASVPPRWAEVGPAAECSAGPSTSSAATATRLFLLQVSFALPRALGHCVGSARTFRAAVFLGS